MKPTQLLVDALRRAADRLTSGTTYYDWMAPSHCNCGILAQACGVPQLHLDGIRGYWHRNAKRLSVCPITEIPMPEVWGNLLAAGLEWNDFEFLEFCDSPEVLSRMGLAVQDRYEYVRNLSARYAEPWKDKRAADPAFVACYFRTQADLLEEQLTPAAPTPAVQHACCHIWLACGVCMLCSATRSTEKPEAVVV